MTPDRWFTVWFSTACLVIGGLITWFFSRHYYRRADKRRIPTFVVGKSHKVLASPELFQIADIQILEGKQPKQPTYIRELLVYFWNSGSLAIQRSDVLDTFTIHLGCPILQCRVLKASRSVVDFKVEKDWLDDLLLEFSVLEPNDGATISIVYEGNEEATPEFRGACLGAVKPTVLPPADFYLQSRWERLKRSPMLALPLIVITGLALAGVGQGMVWLANKFPWLHIDQMQVALGWLFMCLIGALVLLGVVSMFSEGAKKLLSAYIPPEIKP